jgi:hypothetical protein
VLGHILTIRDVRRRNTGRGAATVGLSGGSDKVLNIVMETSRKKSFVSERHEAAAPKMDNSERRRIGRIVHDDRGNASLSWWDAPADYVRPVLEIESESSGLAIQKAPRTFDPYACATPVEKKKTVAAEPRKDLRKLSEWIKMMRELEERKRQGEVE